MLHTLLVLALLGAPLPDGQGHTRTADDFSWHGRIAPGKAIEIKGVNGAIRAELAGGNEVEVSATKRARKSNPDEVEIKVVEHDDGVTICAVYPTPRGRQANECEPGQGGRMDTRDNDVEVAFTVKVPAGVRFVGRTVNGAIRAEGLKSDAEGRSVNGNVQVETTGIAEGSTVNGSVDVVMGRADWRDELEFETVNGAITLTLPASLSAEVEAETVNGSVDSDFPLTISGRMKPTRIRGTIGSGGRELQLKTVNGSIRLRKS